MTPNLASFLLLIIGVAMLFALVGAVAACTEASLQGEPRAGWARAGLVPLLMAPAVLLIFLAGRLSA